MGTDLVPVPPLPFETPHATQISANGFANGYCCPHCGQLLMAASFVWSNSTEVFGMSDGVWCFVCKWFHTTLEYTLPSEQQG